MKSVKADGIVRIKGETLVGKHGKSLLLDEAEVHLLTIKNISRQEFGVDYQVNQQRIRCKLKPGESMDIEVTTLPPKGISVDLGECYFILVPNEIDDNLPTCPKCRSTLELDEVGYCPHCGDDE
jgi:hypothetical protein